jgi:hypothetical protein
MFIILYLYFLSKELPTRVECLNNDTHKNCICDKGFASKKKYCEGNATEIHFILH